MKFQITEGCDVCRQKGHFYRKVNGVWQCETCYIKFCKKFPAQTTRMHIEAFAWEGQKPV